MKLLMRSWADLDPLSALNYAQNHWMPKASEDLLFPRYLPDGPPVTPMLRLWVTQYQKKPRLKRKRKLDDWSRKGVGLKMTAAADISSHFTKVTLRAGFHFFGTEYAKLGTEEAILWAKQFLKRI